MILCMAKDYFDFMKTNKNSILNVIKNIKLANDEFILDILQDAVYRFSVFENRRFSKYQKH